MFAVATWFNVTSTPFNSDLVKPDAVTVRSYLPAKRLLMRYSPAEVDVVVDATPVSCLVAVIEAPGTTAPAGSNTVPVSWPEVVCAKLGTQRAISTTAGRLIWLKNLGVRVL